MEYIVTFSGHAVIISGDPHMDPAGALDEHLDVVMDTLLDLESAGTISTPDISAQLATGHVHIEVIVDAETPEAASKIGLGAIRSAVQAAGGHDPEWDEAASAEWALEYAGSSNRRLDLVDC